MSGQFNAQQLLELDGEEEPQYIVLNDIEIDKFMSLREFFGAQKEFNITNKYMKKIHLLWGKPCIWLNNKDPMITTVHNWDWIMGNMVIVHITEPLFMAPPPPPQLALDGEGGLIGIQPPRTISEEP